MPKFKIYYGFGQPDFHDIIEAENMEEAENIAYNAVMELADSEMTYYAEAVEEEDNDDA